MIKALDKTRRLELLNNWGLEETRASRSIESRRFLSTAITSRAATGFLDLLASDENAG